MLDYLAIIDEFYPADTPLKRLLLLHSEQVRDASLDIYNMPQNAQLGMNRDVVIAGAMLHDIGICRCHAPSILCTGEQNYMAHGIIGGEMLRDYGRRNGLDLEPYARICERHTGTGLTREDIVSQNLPLPPQDFLPETPEEKLICLADKFYSKSSPERVKAPAAARKSMEKFGAETLKRYDELCVLFHVQL